MDPHEADRFRNAATFTVAITFIIAGGARADTARRRGERLLDHDRPELQHLHDHVDRDHGLELP